MKPENEWHTGPHQGADGRRHARRAREAPRRRLQLQPAHQGPRRGVDLRASAGRSWSRSTATIWTLMHDKLEEVEADPARACAARATSRSTAPAARSTSWPTSIARRPRASGCRCTTSRRRWRAPTAASWRPALGGGAPGRRAGQAADVRRRGGRLRASAGWRSRSRATRAACRSRRWRSVHVDRGPHPDQPRAGRAVPGAQVQHRGARHGLASSTRRRRASRREVKLPEGYYLTWGGEFENQRRAMAPPGGDRADLDRRHLRAALPDVRRRAAGAGGAARWSRSRRSAACSRST